MPAQRERRRRTSAGPRAGAGLGREQRRCMTTTGDCPKRDEKMGPGALLRLRLEPRRRADARALRGRARVGRATLPNYALVFGGFSHRWGGAVASVVRAKGACVEGLLYELGNVDLRALDRFEGHPFAYERVMKVGARRERAPPPRDDLPPARGRLRSVGAASWATSRVLWHAYARLGFDVEPLARAAGVSP
jgi:gamma-glutamylcyclotransferase